MTSVIFIPHSNAECILRPRIDSDTRMGYYKDVARKTIMYAFGVNNRGGTRGHVFHPTTAEELLVWDGIVCCIINTNIAESWMMNQSNMLD
jgi:hypothetical protein